MEKAHMEAQNVGDSSCIVPCSGQLKWGSISKALSSQRKQRGCGVGSSSTGPPSHDTTSTATMLPVYRDRCANFCGGESATREVPIKTSMLSPQTGAGVLNERSEAFGQPIRRRGGKRAGQTGPARRNEDHRVVGLASLFARSSKARGCSRRASPQVLVYVA
ncbi:hypothetical protein BKA81DRAFT_11076 [Phyllosticta paracitricarpa]